MFRENSLYSRSFNFLGKLIAMNLLWMVCSLPVLTAGASTTSLFYCALRLHKNGDCEVFKDFFKSFKQNFLQATIIWMILLTGGMCIWMEKKAITTMPGMLPQIFSWVLAALSVLLVVIGLYVFPTLAAFDNKMIRIFTNAFYFALKNVGFVPAVAAITVLPMYFTILDTQMFGILLFVWLLLGFALTAYADAWFFWKLFKPYFPEEKELTSC